MHSCLLREMDRYLTNRQFAAKIGSSFSSFRLIRAGVPQGSVLGPILFNIFFNGIIDNMTCAQVALYADDIAAWYASSSLAALTLHIQKFLNHIQVWLSQWRVKLNISKTIYTIFTKASINNRLKLFFNGSQINYSDSPKFLGISFDSRLTFKHYIDNLVARCLKRLNMMRSIRGRGWGASPKLLLITYKSLIRSLIDYAPILQIVLPEHKQIIIERIQRQAARIISSLPRDTKITLLYSTLNLESTRVRATNLSTKYWDKSILSNQLIAELHSDYLTSATVREGAESRCIPKTTPIGFILSQQNKNSNQQT
jgi:Reverse transcriptase (RNA-dependent DNA polymerase)